MGGGAGVLILRGALGLFLDVFFFFWIGLVQQLMVAVVTFWIESREIFCTALLMFLVGH